MSVDLIKALVDLKKEEVLDEVKKRAEAGENVLGILEECRQGMTIVGENFQKGESFLAELVLSGEIFKAALQILDPYLSASNSGKHLSKVVMATLQGDVHDLGKGIIVTLLKARGFEVIDLGVDVPPAALVSKVKEVKPDFVGFSSLLTPNIKVMKQAVDMLEAEGLRQGLKVMIGGGITTEKAREFVGADFQTLEAMEGVSYCLKIVGGEQ
ncbi:MAG: cobalamin-dependent protein [Dehalobacterium sp.]